MELTRRNVLAGSAGLAGAALAGHEAAAQSSLNAGFILIGPVGDFGWSTMHDVGRRRMLEVLGNRVQATQVEAVAPPDFDRVATQLVRAGCRVVFTTSFSYFAATQRVAQQNPNVMWESATGTSTAANLAIYNARFYEGRYVQGVIAARKSRTKQIGYVASFPVPEVIHAINTVMRGAWTVDPSIRIRVVWVSAWFNPGREADAARALIDQGCDVICQHTDSPAPLQLAEQRGNVFGFGQASDMTRFAPRAHLTSSVNNWGDYYVERARAARWHLAPRRYLGRTRLGHVPPRALHQHDARGGQRGDPDPRRARVGGPPSVRGPDHAPGRHAGHPRRSPPDRRRDPRAELFLSRHRRRDAVRRGSHRRGRLGPDADPVRGRPVRWRRAVPRLPRSPGGV